MSHAVDHAWIRVPALPASARSHPSGTVAALREHLQEPYVREAVWIASVSLAGEIDGYLADPNCARGRRTELALIRYLARMSSRATPFGGFAAVAPLEIGASTRIELEPRSETRRMTRIDGALLGAMTNALSRDPQIRPRLIHRVNSTAYRVADRLRYAEQRFVGRFVAYRLAEVVADEALADLLRLCGDGRTPAQLIEAFATLHPEFARDEVTAFVEAAIDEQVLLPELAPSPTCDDALGTVRATLRAASGARADAVTYALDDVADQLARLDAAGFANGPTPYRAIQATLERTGLVTDAASWWQVDAARGVVHGRIGPQVLREAERLVAVLHRIASPEPQENLHDFKQRFEARYGDREVPLGEALDEESGIGFGPPGTTRDVAPLLVGLPPRSGPAAARAFTPRDAYLLRRVLALAPGEPLVLDETDLLALDHAEAPPQLPDSLAVMAEIAASSAAAVDRGEFLLHLDNVSGPSATRILGRFGHVCPSLAAEGRRHAAAEAALRPDAVFAEIVYLPEGRANNIVARTSLHAHEVVLLARPGVARERCLTLADLRVSVRSGRVMLRSHSLDREVIPRLSCTHNYRGRTFGVYTFLCALQGQDAPNLWFDWGALRAVERLPRVLHGRSVLARARWNVGATALASIAAAREGAKQATSADALEQLRARTFTAVSQLRARYGWPRRVVLVELDHALPVDLDDDAEVEALAAIVKGRSSIVLEEPACSDDELFVDGPGGRHHAQLVISMLRRPPHASVAAVTTRAPEASSAIAPQPDPWQRHHPGSSWAYVKLYAGPSACDDILHSAVSPWLAEQQAAGHVAQWFFLRYADPDVHLRLRLAGDPTALACEVVPSLWRALQPWTNSGTLWRIAQDTYDPETRRYGGPAAMPVIEHAFAADSAAVVAALRACGADEDARWSVTLRGLAGIVAALAGPDDDTSAWVRALRDGFVEERGDAPALRKFLAAQWRRLGEHATAVLDATPPASLEPALAPLRRRDAALRPVGEHLRRLAIAGQLSQPLPSIVASLMHMHVNRMLRADHRAQETLLYDLLLRAAARTRARSKGTR